MAFEIHNNKYKRILEEKENIEHFFNNIQEKEKILMIESYADQIKNDKKEHLNNINKFKNKEENNLKQESENYLKIINALTLYEKNKIKELINYKVNFYKELIIFLELKINKIKKENGANFISKYKNEIAIFLEKDILKNNFPSVIIQQILITKIYDIVRILSIEKLEDKNSEDAKDKEISL